MGKKMVEKSAGALVLYLALHVLQLSPNAPHSAICVLLYLGHMGPQTDLLLLEGIRDSMLF